MKDIKDIEVSFKEIKPRKRINWVWVFIGAFVVMLMLSSVGVISLKYVMIPIILVWLVIIITLVRILIFKK